MNRTIMAIDIGSSVISCVIAEIIEGNPKVIGVGFAKSLGIRRGSVIHIDNAAQSIKNAIAEAKQMSGSDINRAIISISGEYVTSRNNSGVVSISRGEIRDEEIQRVIQGALHNSGIPAEYEVIHVLPYQFIVDEQDNVDDPKGMSGSRLKAMVHIVTVQKTILENLRKAVKIAGIEIDNIVLASYASSIAVLSEDEKELGAVCIDIGGDTCDIMIHNGNSMCFDGILPVGSNHITKDIAHVCNTSPNTAEKLKIDYGEVIPIHSNMKFQTFEVSAIGSDKTRAVSHKTILEVINARLTETFCLLHGIIDRIEIKDQIGAGIVFTGGLTQLKGLESLIEACFVDSYPTRLASPKEIEGMPQELKNPACSTVVGLILYGSGYFTNYEMDSEKRLKIRKSQFILEEEKQLLPTYNEATNEKLDLFKEDLEPKEKQSTYNSFKHWIAKLF